jgi:CDGSH-type Zn-finger protein
MDLIPNEGLPRIAEKCPIKVKLLPEKEYKWCTCGITATEPFCDTKHKEIEGTPFKSLRFTVDEDKEVWLCRCKQTKNPPYCDGSHKKL